MFISQLQGELFYSVHKRMPRWWVRRCLSQHFQVSPPATRPATVASPSRFSDPATGGREQLKDGAFREGEVNNGICRDFPGGAVVENPPANAEDTGSSPGLGRSHMPQSNWVCAPQLLSLCSRARAPQLLSPRATTTETHVPRACAPQERPQREAHAQQRRPNTAKNK